MPDGVGEQQLSASYVIKDTVLQQLKYALTVFHRHWCIGSGFIVESQGPQARGSPCRN
jgi:hypothetical protein